MIMLIIAVVRHQTLYLMRIAASQSAYGTLSVSGLWSCDMLLSNGAGMCEKIRPTACYYMKNSFNSLCESELLSIYICNFIMSK